MAINLLTFGLMKFYICSRYSVMGTGLWKIPLFPHIMQTILAVITNRYTMYILPVSLFNFGIAAVDNLLIIEYMSISSHTHCVTVVFFIF